MASTTVGIQMNKKLKAQGNELKGQNSELRAGGTLVIG